MTSKGSRGGRGRGKAAGRSGSSANPGAAPRVGEEIHASSSTDNASGPSDTSTTVIDVNPANLNCAQSAIYMAYLNQTPVSITQVGGHPLDSDSASDAAKDGLKPDDQDLSSTDAHTANESDSESYEEPAIIIRLRSNAHRTNTSTGQGTMDNVHERCCDVARNMLLPRQVANIFPEKSSQELRTLELQEIVMRYARIVKGNLKKNIFKNTSLSSEKDPVPESSTPLPSAATGPNDGPEISSTSPEEAQQKISQILSRKKARVEPQPQAQAEEQATSKVSRQRKQVPKFPAETPQERRPAADADETKSKRQKKN
ncbi:hypothetical protein VTN00DRAFT_7791 [Thermoascus crustaceus]|uniref:uncharacterized protein n=1 Tax=Thermoascus crustaceus TaxID=5088 RepID=UPI0037447CC9